MEETLKDASNLNPLALVFLLVMCGVLLCSSRQNAVKAMLATAALVPLGQQLVVFGLHLHFLRLLILAGLCRLLMRGETRALELTGLDKLFIAWALVGLACGILRNPSAETFGAAYNALGAYFLFRILTKEPADTVDHLRLLTLLAIVIGACMTWEIMTHRNLFSIFGGVPEITVQRGDRFRCQGPFRHPILAGTFGATLFPLLVGLWFQGRQVKWRVLLGIAGCLIITVVSASSGALLTFLAAMIGIGLWPMRNHMRLFRRGSTAVIIGLALMMNAPVWYLIARVSDITGGTGWHRSFLIDTAIKHINEWWLIGTSFTAHWGGSHQVLLVDPNNMDLTNHYVVQGVGGGIWMLGLFLAMIVVCFKVLGRGVRAEFDLALDRKLLWAMGVTLASHCTAFISISYFDQIYVFWFWLLAVISSLARHVQQRPATAKLSPSSPEVELSNAPSAV